MTHGVRGGPLWQPMAIALAASALYLVGLDRYPQFDELYHMLAAQGWMATGEPRIAEGIYSRDSWFTALVGWLFGHFGVSLEVARLPTVAMVGLLVGVMFAWIRREAGTAAALIGAGLFAVSPFAIEIAQFSRAYAFQMVGFFVAVVATYRLVLDRRIDARAVVLGLLAIAGMALAFKVQIATAAGAAGLILWVGLAIVGPWLIDPAVPLGRKVAATVAASVVGAAALGGLVHTGLIHDILAPLGETNLTIASREPQFWFYHGWLILYYPTLWSVVPLLAIAAIARAPKPALLALCVFVTALLVHSVAAAKNLRYFAYAMPFLFAIWGIGLAQVGGAAIRVVRDQTSRAVELLPRPAAVWFGRTAIVVGTAYLVLANAATLRSIALLVGATIPPEVPPPRWELAKPALEADLDTAQVVVTSSELEQLYFLGRYDVLMSRSRIFEVPPSTPFIPDFRTGRPIIARAEDLATLMACYSSGLVVSPSSRWRNAAQIDDAAADLLTRNAERIDLDSRARIVAYRWTHSIGTATDCPALPGVRNDGPAIGESPEDRPVKTSG